VDEWGETDDGISHEFVELSLSIISNPHLHAVALEVAKSVGHEIVKLGLGALASEAVKALIARLAPKQKEGRISEFSITLPDGANVKFEAGKLSISLTSNTAGKHKPTSRSGERAACGSRIKPKA
jgi:hypothetical protein